MVKFYTAEDLFEANEIEGKLAEHGIMCKIKENSVFLLPGAVQKSVYEIYVPEKQADTAVEALGTKQASSYQKDARTRRMLVVYFVCLILVTVFICLTFWL